MDKSTIQTLIDKVIGKKGLIRVPSWWMRKVLMQMADWVQEGDDANSEKTVKVKEEADEKINALDNNTRAALVELKKSLHTQRCVVVKTGTSAGLVYVDGSRQSIPANTQKVVSFSEKIKFGERLNSGDYPRLTYIGLTVTDMSSITDMSYMFYFCQELTSLDLSGLNTSAVTSMAYMFSYCSNLTSLDLTGLNTSAVTDMRNMFNSCYKLTSLDLSGLNTSAVTDMSNMFNSCYKLTSLDLSGFNTSAVTNMQGVFYDCRGLTSLDLSTFDTSAVTDMRNMFNSCQGLTSLDLSGFNTSAVTSMSNMFYLCSSLASLILGPNFFKTSQVTSIDFSSCSKWVGDTVVTSLVTNSYDRASAGLGALTLKLSTNTKAALTDEQKAAITAKGYTIA